MNDVRKNGRKLFLSFLLVMLMAVGMTACGTNEPVGDAEDTPSSAVVAETEGSDTSAVESVEYTFRNDGLLQQHYKKHGIEMGFDSAEDYEKAAGEVIQNPEALHKTEAEDGDDVYYVEATNEFVVLSSDGYIRTYFLPDAGIAYFERQ